MRHALRGQNPQSLLLPWSRSVTNTLLHFVSGRHKVIKATESTHHLEIRDVCSQCVYGGDDPIIIDGQDSQFSPLWYHAVQAYPGVREKRFDIDYRPQTGNQRPHPRSPSSSPQFNLLCLESDMEVREKPS